ncbi:hypothetical protein BMT55_06760 [Listeria newyorkensis]|uniref:DUF1911 domain-containing protein n=1 Tax=Listeria newyorkensis TaxID=1497681 RepID=A0ABX4XPP4_9LIST|nr:MULTISPECIES: PoNe immunity protein domain-containing protein [Listeria]KGL39572.1 hypothetical protein EP56_13495 [Listeriaceae bacterium FSL A5-0209]KGL44156.1 hypothetical protein EP58_06830 [Listeria newyorkensis]PNP93121.1 hypothetical protein BMT55_06760 [Listeria newyorkensis]RQW67118.1 DUF1911 domain-containing protein [Listeria sp. SHR_NRA_18]SQC57753.1 Domain of uncharacterised function (DUF1911) [Listeria newyorkensis]
MIRDYIKDELYFKEYIAQQKQRIEKFQLKLDANEVAENRVFAVKEKIEALKFQILVAGYSSGERFGTLKGQYEEIVANMADFWDVDASYSDILWMLSIGIMLEIDDNSFDLLKDLVLQSEEQDFLLRYLIHYRDRDVDFMSSQFLHEAPYMYLGDVINKDQNTAVISLKNYLTEKWYEGNADSGWFDIHNEKEKLYYGYWSFESGAIAKIMDLDDDVLKGVPFYPYDLVHYKNSEG